MKIRLYNEHTNSKIAEESVSTPEDLRSALGRIFKTHPNATNLTLETIVDTRDLERLPTDARGREMIIGQLEDYLDEQIRKNLSESDYQIFLRAAMEAAEPTGHRIRVVLDKIILQAAEELGVQILTAKGAFKRIEEWQSEGDAGEKRLCKLGKQLGRHARLLDGNGKAPLEWWARYRSEIIKELKLLRKRISGKITASINGRRLSNLIEDAIEASPESFPTLFKIAVNLQVFINSNPEETKSFFDNGVTPASFTDSLIAAATHRTPQAARQVMSRILNAPASRSPKL
jgi:hypothetical protein